MLLRLENYKWQFEKYHFNQSLIIQAAYSDD
jgi:hypothetical protein